MPAIGQTARTDSLQKLVVKENDPQKKLALLNQISFQLFDIDTEKANATTWEAFELARNMADIEEKAWAIVYRGIWLMFTGKLRESEALFLKSLSIGSALNNTNINTYCLTQLGNVARDKGSFDSAYQLYKEAYQSSQKQGTDPFYVAVVRMNLARYFLVRRLPDSAKAEIEQVIVARKNSVDSLRLMDAFMLLGNCYRLKEDYARAEQYFAKVLPHAKKDNLLRADYLQSLGEINFKKGDFAMALKNWNEALAYHRHSQYKYILTGLLLRLGSVFDQQGYYDLATEYLTEAIKMAETCGYRYLIGQIAYEQAWVCYRNRNFELSLANRSRAAEIFKAVKAFSEYAGSLDLKALTERRLRHYDTALYYHRASLRERQLYGSQFDISASYFNLGEFYWETGNHTIAKTYYRKSLSIDSLLQDNYGRSLNYNRLGKIYTALSRFDSAKFFFDQSMRLAIPTTANDVLRQNFLDLASYYEKQGKPSEAIPYYKKYNLFSDSIFNKHTAQSMAAYKILYDVAKREQEIIILSKDVALSNALVAQQRTILIAALVGSALLSILAVFYYRFNTRLKKLNLTLAERAEEIQAQSEELAEANQVLFKLNREISEQKEEIQAQAEELVENNQTLEERIDMRTAELKQAYKELDTFFYRSSHDFRRPLTTFMGLAEVAKITIKDPNALELFDKVNETAHNLDKMLMKLQLISDLGAQELLYKEVFVEEILNRTVTSFDQELLSRGIKVIVEVMPSLSLYTYPALLKIIFDNLVENSISFCKSQDAHLYIRAFLKEERVLIEIEDDGQGIESIYLNRIFEMYFRGNEQSKGNGLGLYIVKKAVDRLNGRIEITSVIQMGTKVSVLFPRKLETIL